METRATTRRRVLRARVRRATANLPPGRAHQDPLEDLELLEALAGPDRDRGKRAVGDVDRHAGLVAEPLVEPAEQSASAGERDAPVHDVPGELRRGSVQGRLDRVDDR